jgi:hypothetical protein
MTRKLKIEELKIRLSLIFTIIISPLLSIPAMVYGLLKKDKVVFTFIALAFALIGYQMIPTELSDLTKHYALFEEMKTMSLNGLFEVFKRKPDFLFYLGMYLLAKAGFAAPWIVFITVYISLKNYFKIYHELFSSAPLKLYLLGFFLLILSIKWSFLFLGLRNYLGYSFAFLALFNLVIGKRSSNYIYLLLACFIHFTSLVFLPIYYLLKISKGNGVKFRNVFLLSFIFVLLTKDILLSILQIVPSTELIEAKINGYLGKDDLVEREINSSVSAYISYSIQFLWYYFGALFLVLTINKRSKIRDAVYILFAITNVFFVSPDTFNRLGIIVRPALLFLILCEIDQKFRKIWLYIFIVLLLMYAFVDFYITKNVYFWSLFQLDALTTISMLLKEYYIQPIK